MTAILLILIAVIGLIAIIIVKLYYRDKEKDDEKEKLEEFINSTKADYDNEKRKRARSSRNRANFSEAQSYANTIDSQYKEEIKDARRARKAIASESPVENENIGGTTALLRQRAKAMENAPKKQVRRVKKPQAEASNAPRKVQRTPQRVKAQMNKEEEVKSFQEPIKPEHTATINSAKQKAEQPKARQVPMTEKQKEFIENEANKLIVDDGDSAVKVVKSIKPADTIDEIKESAKIEDATEKAEESKVVEKAEKDTAELIEKIDEVKEGLEEKLADAVEEAKESVKEEIADAKEEAEEAKETVQEKIADAKEEAEEAKETVQEKIADAKESAKEEIADAKEEAEEAKETVEEKIAETPNIESTIEKIKQAAAEKEKAKEEDVAEAEMEEDITIVGEPIEEEKSTFIDGSSKVSEKISEAAKKVYNDDLHLILNKGEKEEVDQTPENDFVTINSDTEPETSSPSNELISNAIKSIRNFRKPNVPETPVVVEEVDDIVPDDYAQDLGDGIEYIGDTITITPIHEEEVDLAKNQPNEDVDKIYKEINKESYNKTDDEELSESFEDVTDETSEKDANVYTEEDYKKIEAKEKEKKRRVANTKKILGSKGISEEELRQRAEAKARSKRTRKAATAETEPVEDGQKRLMMHKARSDVEEVYINGTLFELKVGQVVIFEINGENYSSQILRLKPGFIGVRYRSKNIWVKSNTVKKILK